MNFKLVKYAPQKGVNRKAGECNQLLNTTPMRIAGSETTRYGYSSAGLTAPSDITAEHRRFPSTENPSAQDCEVLFGVDGSSNKHVYLKPYIPKGSSTFTDNYILLDESVTVTASTTISTREIHIEGTDALGFSTTSNYYAGWRVKNTTLSTYAYIVSSTYSSASGGTIYFTTVEPLDQSPNNWQTSHDLLFTRWFHGVASFDPTYGSYPHAHTRDGVIRISGGKGTTAGFKGIWAGYINRTFFPSDARTFTYQGTYVDQRECPAGLGVSVGVGYDAPVNDEVALETGYTYWFGIGVVYDDSQYSPITFAAGQYVDSGDSSVVHLIPQVNAGSLSKRITDVIIFMGRDKGNTEGARVNPVFSIKELSLTDSSVEWEYSDSDESFLMEIVADKTLWDNRKEEWSRLSGYTENTNKSFSYDLETGFQDRQWIGRVYDYTAGKEDLDRIYTNPRSGDGVIQPDIFSLEPDIFTQRVLWGDASYITAIHGSERGRLLVSKDRGLVDFAIVEQNDGSLVFSPTTISTQHGCTSVNGSVKTPYGVFFVGYDDIFLYDGKLNFLVIEDWLDAYKAISSANKQAAFAWFRPEDSATYFQFGSSVYTTFKDFGWRQATYAHTISSLSVKRDNTVVFISSGTAYQFDTTTTDAGTAISAKWQTGKFKPTEHGGVSVFSEAFVNKSQVGSSGTLDCEIITTIDGDEVAKQFEGLDKSQVRLWLPKSVEDNGYCDFLEINYNTDASPETGVVQFDMIEVKMKQEQKVIAA